MASSDKRGRGERLGGRAKGTPNKRNVDTAALIEKALGCSPLEKMATLARELLDGTRTVNVPVSTRNGIENEHSEAKALEIATKLLSEIAGYHSPKRKAVEVEFGDKTLDRLPRSIFEVVSARG